MLFQNPLKFSLLGALLIPCIARLNLMGTGHENDLFRYIAPFLVGAAAGYLIGLWKKKSERLLTEKITLAQKLQDELINRQRTAAILLSEEKLSLLLSHTTEGIYGLDTDGRCTFCNPSFLNMLGYKNEAELLGQKIHQLIHHTRPDGTPYASHECKAHKGFMEGIAVHVEDEVFWKKDGKAIHVEYRSHPISKDNQITGAVITVINISKRWQATQALHESEERYRSLVQTANDAIVSINRFGEIIFWNTSAERIFGYSEAKILGRNVTDIMPDKYRQAHQNALTAITTSDHSNLVGRSIELTGRKEDGTEFPIELSLSTWERQGILCFTSIIRDISDRKEADHEKAKLSERLQQARKMEAIGLMAGGVAHDLNNILSGIVSYPELVLMKLPKDSTVRPAVEAIHESGLRAGEVVADLLTVARGVAGSKLTASLNTLTIECLTSPEGAKLKEYYPNIKILTKYQKNLHNIYCSPVHIKKCLMNLITNATEAMNQKGRIIISTRNQYLAGAIDQHNYVQKGDYAVLKIEDTGEGISENDIEHIFEPFYTKKIMGRSGTGLGLAIVWNTIKDHGGGISVISNEKGTCFELYFPISKDPPTQKIQSLNINELMGSQEKILVVDDEPLLRKIAGDILESLNYQSHTVSSGEEAVKYLQKEKVDLVILDMVMAPGINGRETYEQILKIHPDQKAVICSGFSENTEVEKAQKLGAGAFIKKPYSLEQLGHAVKDGLIRD